MNQEKIGKFISNVRKDKKLTQRQLADKLGITDRAISKWENGKSMPDLSLLKPLCDILDISINELLNGEYLNNKDDSNNLEDNFVNVINYNKKKQNNIEIIFYLFISLFGTIMIFLSMLIFNTPGDFTTERSILGTYNLMIIFSFLLKKLLAYNKSQKKVILLIISFFIIYFGYLWTIDYINVTKNNGYPDIFVVSTSVSTDTYSYDTFFYDLHICNINQDNKFRKIIFNMNHNIDFNEIDTICKGK